MDLLTNAAGAVERLNIAWVIELLTLAVGGLLLARGLKIYKTMQAIVCMLFFGSIGLFIQSYFGKQELYILVLVLAMLGLFLGIRYYKFGLYILAYISSWLAIFSYFWKQTLVTLRGGLGDVIDMKQFLVLLIENSFKTSDVIAAVVALLSLDHAVIVATVEKAVHTLQTGIMWAGIIGTVIAVMVLFLGDFIIILVTSALGATVITSLFGNFIELSPNIHLIVLIVFTGIGIALQSSMKKR